MRWSRCALGSWGRPGHLIVRGREVARGRGAGGESPPRSEVSIRTSGASSKALVHDQVVDDVASGLDLRRAIAGVLKTPPRSTLLAGEAAPDHAPAQGEREDAKDAGEDGSAEAVGAKSGSVLAARIKEAVSAVCAAVSANAS
eukprot:5168072-Alexandrium_andersonii.AAC.1